MTTGSDVVVIGGGAAGIAAARALRRADRDVLLLEAGDRLGGRAHTVVHDGMALDLGCGWLHSATRNPMVALAVREGLAVDRSGANWGTQWRDLGFPPADRAAFDAAWAAWDARARIAARYEADRPLGDFLGPAHRWRPLSDAISGFVNGAPLAAVSTHDWAAYEMAATGDNWRVREGYGTLVARLGAGLPCRLGTRANRVDHRDTTIRIETDAGTITTRAVVVCVPTAMLADSGLRFLPDLPAKRDAAARLPLGLADKLFLRVDGGDLPTDAHLIGNPASEHTASYRLGAMGWPLVECFFGGALAEELTEAGPDTTVQFAVSELTALLGRAWRTRLRPIATTRWRTHPHIGGSYSHAMVGHAGARAVLAAPVDDRLFFAGEACSPGDFSTCHGAWASGEAAAAALLAGLRPGSPQNFRATPK